MPTPDGGVIADMPLLGTVACVSDSLRSCHNVLVHGGGGVRMARAAVIGISTKSSCSADPAPVAAFRATHS